MERMTGIESVLWVSRSFFSQKVPHKVSNFLSHAKLCQCLLFCIDLEVNLCKDGTRPEMSEIIKVVTTLPSKGHYQKLGT